MMSLTMARITRLLVIAGLAVWLAACSTMVPVTGLPEASPAAANKPAVAVPSLTVPDTGRNSDATPADVSPAIAADGTPLLELLAGEIPREFEHGSASWYGPRFHGRRTASGERYDMHALTAAHRTLPFGTMVRVRSMVNGHEVDVRVTDRGPFSRNRVIDVSRAAAEALGMLGLGVKPVVLLVPESTSAIAEPPPSAKKSRRARRSPEARAG